MRNVQIAAGAMALVFACAAGAFAQPPQDEPVPGNASPFTGDPEAGGSLFESSCEACHANGIGPSLHGVIGRAVASVADFPGYTAALKAKGGESWTEAGLDAFFTDAQAYAPGTAMTVVIPNAQERADLIAFIASMP